MITNPNQTVLSLDTATKTGYAIYQQGEIITYNTIKLKNTAKESDLFNRLTKLIRKYKVTHVVAEDIYKDSDIRKKAAYEVLSRLRGIVEAVTQLEKVSTIYYHPAAWKRYYIGFNQYNKGNRDKQKQQSMDKATRLGYSVKTDDEADAIGILITYIESNKLPIKHPRS